MTTDMMKLVPALVAALALGLVACDKKGDGAKATPAAGGNTTGTHDDHDHDDHDHDHEGDDHDHEGEKSLGAVVAGGYEVEALVAGEVKAGEEAHVTVKVEGGEGTVAAVRVWVGAEDAAGSIKAKGETEEHGYHAHVEVPTNLSATDRLWVELEKEDGATVAVSFAL